MWIICGCSVCKSVGDAGSSVTGYRIRAFRQNCHIPVQVWIVDIQVIDSPASKIHHSAFTGEETFCFTKIREITLVWRKIIIGLPSDIFCDTFLCCRIIKSGFCLIIINIVATCLINGICPSFLLILICHHTVFSSFFMNSFRCFYQIIPGPCIIRIGNTCFIKDVFVIYKTDGINIFHNPIDFVFVCKVLNQICREVIVIIVRVFICIQVCQICQHTCLCIFTEFIDVHPENIRQGITVCHSFQFCPVLTPCGNLYFNRYIRMFFMVCSRQSFHTCLLIDFPSKHRQFYFSVISGRIRRATVRCCCIRTSTVRVS